MDCPNGCGEMKRVVDRINGKVYWHCRHCGYSELTEDLAPSPINDWEENDEN